MNTILNPFKIKWALVVLGQTPKTDLVRSLNHGTETGSASINRNYFFFHGTGEYFDKRFIKALTLLNSSDISATIYTFTDKQYGMIQNTYNGSIPESPKPFSHSVIIKDKMCVSLVPLTKEQYNDRVEL